MFWCCPAVASTAMEATVTKSYGALGADSLVVAEQLAAEPRQAPLVGKTQDAALQALRDGNKRFVAAASVNQGVAGMEMGPTTTVVGCADLFLPEELIFDAKPSDLLVVRGVGNTFTQSEDSVVTTLEFNASHMNTNLVFVLGHIGCSAMDRACNMRSGRCTCSRTNGSNLFANLMDSVMQAEMELPADCDQTDLATLAVKVNVIQTMRRLLEGSHVLREKVRSGKLSVQGGLFDPDTGMVQFLGPSPNEAAILGSSIPTSGTLSTDYEPTLADWDSLETDSVALSEVSQ